MPCCSGQTLGEVTNCRGDITQNGGIRSLKILSSVKTMKNLAKKEIVRTRFFWLWILTISFQQLRKHLFKNWISVLNSMLCGTVPSFTLQLYGSLIFNSPDSNAATRGSRTEVEPFQSLVPKELSLSDSSAGFLEDVTCLQSYLHLT